jgi:hypothetical protein
VLPKLFFSRCWCYLCSTPPEISVKTFEYSKLTALNLPMSCPSVCAYSSPAHFACHCTCLALTGRISCLYLSEGYVGVLTSPFWLSRALVQRFFYLVQRRLRLVQQLNGPWLLAPTYNMLRGLYEASKVKLDQACCCGVIRCLFREKYL